MASIEEVGLQLTVKGEKQAIEALERLEAESRRVTSGIGKAATAISGIEKEMVRLTKMNERGVLTATALTNAKNTLAKRLAVLNGEIDKNGVITKTNARAMLDNVEATQRKTTADARAAQQAKEAARQERETQKALEERRRAQINLEGSILKQGRAVRQAVERTDELNRLQAQGAISADNLAQGQLEIARSVAATNGYLKTNGDLNTQKAQSEIRAAQATREAAEAAKRQEAEVKQIIATRQREEVATREAKRAYQEYIRGVTESSQANRSAAASMDVFAAEAERLAQKFNPLYAESKRYEAQLEELNRAKSIGAVNSQQYDAALEQLNASLAGNAQAAKQSSAATQSDANSKDQARNEYNRLRAAIDQNYAARMRIRQASQTLRKAVEAEIITTQEAAHMLRQYGAAAAASSGYVAQTARRTNQLGVLMQQTGYQVGDFAVQVQSGTNVMVALGQQATQLVGTFGMLAKSTGAIALFAALGIAVPIVTALAGAMMRVESSSEVFDKLADSLAPVQPLLSAAAAAMNALANGAINLANLIVNNLDRVVATATALAGVFAVKLVIGFGKAATAAGAMTKALNVLKSAMMRFPLTALVIAAGELVYQFINIVNVTGSVGKAFSAIGQIIKEVFTFDSIVNGLLALNAKTSEIVMSMVATFLQFGVDVVANIGEPFNKIGAIVMGTVEGIKSVFSTIADYIGNIGAKAANLFISGMEKLANGAIKAVNKVISGFNKFAEFVGADKAAEFFGFSVGFDELEPADLSKYKTQVEEQGKTVGQAFTDGYASGYDESLIATPVMDTLQRMVDEARSTSDIMGELADAYGEKFMAANPALEELINKLKEARGEANSIDVRDLFGGSADGDTAGGGGAATQAETGYLDGLLREAELKRQMAGVSEEEARRLEIINQLKEKELLVDGQLSETQRKKIEQILREKQLTDQVIEQKKREEAIQMTVQKNLENGMMSLVENTKSVEDAFKGMMRNIILETYKQKVAKPFATTIMEFLPFANGNAFNNGRVVPFANGGVVNSDTYFPMANGKTGLMGEAGPEAIMPLKRGRDGKLGVVAQNKGGGNVTVNQYFQISANGDESVKRIVRQEAPRIAEQAKAAVVDSKRRGGSYGRAFN